jgi:hypothetical protein
MPKAPRLAPGCDNARFFAKVLRPVSMLYPSMDPNERFRSRRASIVRRRRRRRAAVLLVVLAVVITVGGGAKLVGSSGQVAPPAATPAPAAPSASPTPSVPVEIRGVHVTAPLASIPGKLERYVALAKSGLNTIQLDVKDEGGEVGFVPSSVPLARSSGAARPYYKPREAVRLAHEAGLYVIGRVVTFQDPYLARARPDLAIKHRDGSTWKTSAGLAWVNPYDRRVWSYNVAIAQAAARAGFDEIMFDYVRFPSDGDIGAAVYAGRSPTPPAKVIAGFLSYANKQLQPLGVHVSAAVFGLSATRDLGIGQNPRLIARHVDRLATMTYPVLFGGGELGIANPGAEPGETVFRALGDFRKAIRGSSAQLMPWVQDFSGYSLQQVRAQVDALRLQGAKGYLLWNPYGEYHAQALAPAGGADALGTTNP